MLISELQHLPIASFERLFAQHLHGDFLAQLLLYFVPAIVQEIQ